MFATHPAMAKRWAAHTPSGKKLPEHVKKKGRTKKAGDLLDQVLAKRAETNVGGPATTPYTTPSTTTHNPYPGVGYAKPGGRGQAYQTAVNLHDTDRLALKYPGFGQYHQPAALGKGIGLKAVPPGEGQGYGAPTMDPARAKGLGPMTPFDEGWRKGADYPVYGPFQMPSLRAGQPPLGMNDLPLNESYHGDASNDGSHLNPPTAVLGDKDNALAEVGRHRDALNKRRIELLDARKLESSPTAPSPSPSWHEPYANWLYENRYPILYGAGATGLGLGAYHLYNSLFGRRRRKEAAAKDGPPNYHLTGPLGPACRSCKHFEGSTSTCTKYATAVQPSGLCDAYEAVALDTSALVAAGKPQAPKPSDIKLAAGPGLHPGQSPTVRGLHRWFDAIEAHPDYDPSTKTISGRTAVRLSKQARLSTEQAFKAGFVLRCIEDGRSPEDAEALAKTAAGPIPSWLLSLWGAVSRPASTLAAGLGSTVLGKGIDLGTAALIGAPITAGLVGGHVLGRLQNLHDRDDVDVLKHENLAAEYQRLAEQAEQKAKMRELDARDGRPGDFIQIG